MYPKYSHMTDRRSDSTDNQLTFQTQSHLQPSDRHALRRGQQQWRIQTHLFWEGHSFPSRSPPSRVGPAASPAAANWRVIGMQTEKDDPPFASVLPFPFLLPFSSLSLPFLPLFLPLPSPRNRPPGSGERCNPSAGSVEPQPKSNLVHFSLKM